MKIIMESELREVYVRELGEGSWVNVWMHGVMLGLGPYL